MSRFFSGMGSSMSKYGKKKTGISNATNSYDKMMATKAALQNGGKPEQLSPEERYKKIMDDKMGEYKQKLLSGAKKSSVMIPGTRQEAQREMSKSAKLMLKQIAEADAKKEMKKQQNKIALKYTPIVGPYGGFIDAQGRVFNNQRQQVFKIDLKTGDVKTLGLLGRRIMKFDPKSGNSVFKLYKAMEKLALQTGQGVANIWGNTPTASGGASAPSAMESIWGKNTGGTSGGSGWDSSKGW